MAYFVLMQHPVYVFVRFPYQFKKRQRMPNRVRNSGGEEENAALYNAAIFDPPL